MEGVTSNALSVIFVGFEANVIQEAVFGTDGRSTKFVIAGFMLLTFMILHFFQLHFADVEQYFLRPPGISYVAEVPVLSLVVTLVAYVVMWEMADVVSGCHFTDNLHRHPHRTCANAARSSHRYIHIRPEVVGWAPPV